MRSAVIKRSVAIGGHKTSISLEEKFWRALHDIAAGRHMPLSALLMEIDANRQSPNMSSQIRLFVLDHYRTLGHGVGIEWGVAEKRSGKGPVRG